VREQRRAPRVPVSHMMVRLNSGLRLVHGDVSLTGVGFVLQSACYVKPKDVLEVKLYLPDQVVLLKVVVRRIRRLEPWSLGKMFVGADILSMDELVANPLFRFVEESALARRAIAPTSRPTSAH